MKKVTTSLTLVLSLFLLMNLNPFSTQASSIGLANNESTDLEGMVRADMMGNYFSRIDLAQLKKDDEGDAIKTGLENAQSQVQSIQSLLHDLSRNDSKQVREYVYNKMLKAELEKFTGFLGKAALNNIFDNHHEPDDELKKKVQELKKKLQ